MRLWMILVAILASPAVSAAETTWQTLSPALKARIISADSLGPDGRLLIGLDLALAPGARTYWRIAGAAGLATHLDFSGSDGIGATEIVWPQPQVLIEEGLLEYVYTSATLLPIWVELPHGRATLSIAYTGGVCTDICMPLSGAFTLAVGDAVPDRASAVHLAQALATTPIAWDQATPPLRLEGCETPPGTVTLSVLDPTLDATSVILTGDRADVLYLPESAAADTAPSDRLVFERIPQSSPVERNLTASFSTPAGPYALRLRCASTAK
jgi:DsbC/DsbD-like thiol-disulfide interchange protein